MSHSVRDNSIRRFLRQSWQILAGLALAFFGLAYVAWGATYNFYFNNTEQGDNSTATPAVTITEDGKVVKKPGDGTDPKALSATPAQAQGAPAAPEARSQAEQAAAAPSKDASELKWRFLIGLTAQKQYGAGASLADNGGLQPSGSVSYFFNHEFGLTAYGTLLTTNGEGWYSYDETHYMLGLEAELVPIRLTFGRTEDLVDVAVVAGAQAEYHSLGADGQTYYYDSPWHIRPEGGVRVSLNLGHAWSVTGIVRANPDFATGEAALAFRL
jgi:hypothetical protein